MRALVAIALITCGLAGNFARAEETKIPNTLVPVSTFTAKDLADPEPGKSAWAKGNQWSFGILVYDRWVYTASTAEYILQFERNPATASLKYCGATAFGHHDPEGGVGVNRFFVRRMPGGNAILYLDYGSHGPHLFAWYALDGKTGRLTPKGKQVPPKVGVGLLTPDEKRMYNVSNSKITWSRFDDDGTPVEEGGADCKDIGHYGQFILSPDGRNVYTIIATGLRVDAYACDAKSGKPAPVASLDVESAVKRTSGLMPLSPDGRHVYLFNGGFFSDKNPGDTACILSRDVHSGTLTILQSGKTDPNLYGLGGPAWSRQSRLAFTSDGRHGCFISLGGFHHRPTMLGTLTRDPATGALTVTAAVSARGKAAAMTACRLALDPDNGNLFTVGDSISSYATVEAEATPVK